MSQETSNENTIRLNELNTLSDWVLRVYNQPETDETRIVRQAVHMYVTERLKELTQQELTNS